MKIHIKQILAPKAGNHQCQKQACWSYPVNPAHKGVIKWFLFCFFKSRYYQWTLWNWQKHLLLKLQNQNILKICLFEKKKAKFISSFSACACSHCFSIMCHSLQNPHCKGSFTHLRGPVVFCTTKIQVSANAHKKQLFFMYPDHT